MMMAPASGLPPSSGLVPVNICVCMNACNLMDMYVRHIYDFCLHRHVSNVPNAYMISTCYPTYALIHSMIGM